MGHPVARQLLLWMLMGVAASAQEDLESRAAKAFAANDCKTAEPLYDALLAAPEYAAQPGKRALFWRYVGRCRYRIPNLEGALQAYRSGTEAALESADLELQAENYHGQSVVLGKLGQLEEALEMANRELQLAEKCSHTRHLARGLSQIAIANQALGRERVAQQAYERMLEVARAGKDAESELMAMDSLSHIYAGFGDPATALRYQQMVLARTDPKNTAEMARIYGNLAIMEQVKLEESIVLANKALQLALQSSSWRTRETILFNLGMRYQRVGRLPESRRAFEETIALAVEHKESDMEGRVRAALAELLLQSKEWEKAGEQATLAVALARSARSPGRLYEALSALGRYHELTGRNEEAAAAMTEAALVVESLRVAAPGDPQALQAALRASRPVYLRLVRHLLDRQQPEQTLSWAERAKARTLDDVLSRGGIEEKKSMTTAEAAEERRLYRNVERNAMDRAKAAHAIGELEVFRRQLYNKHPELALQRADFEPASLAQLQRLAPAGGAMLEYFLLEDGAALFIIRPTGMQIVRLHFELEALTAEIRSFRTQLANRDINYQATARALHAKLLAPAAQALHGATRWVISPDGPLWELPFQALLEPGGQAVLQNHPVSYSPSLTALWRMHERGTTRANGAPLELLAIGNPKTALTALPEAEEEVRDIRQFYPAARTLLLTGSQAGPAAFRDQAPRAAVIHVAAHAELNNANPLYSLLRLAADANGAGVMPASEILRMPLRARLAVLSACETARGDSSNEGLLGMGWALAGAGVPASVLSHWKVDSAATRQLMVAFHRHLRPGKLAPADALRRAALEVMAMPGYRHPFYWAAFVTVGDGFR